MYQKLLILLKGATKVAFMGIGEEKLSDDGVGPYIISQLLNDTNDRFLFINAGINPMDRIDEIVRFKASHLVLLDTCTLKKTPGTVAIIERENICEFVPISTHTIPIHIVVDLLVKKLPDLKVFMLGFVPESLEGFTDLKLFKEGELTIDELNENIDLPFFEFNFSKTVQKAADEIVAIIKKIVKQL